MRWLLLVAMRLRCAATTQEHFAEFKAEDGMCRVAGLGNSPNSPSFVERRWMVAHEYPHKTNKEKEILLSICSNLFIMLLSTILVCPKLGLNALFTIAPTPCFSNAAYKNRLVHVVNIE